MSAPIATFQKPAREPRNPEPFDTPPTRLNELLASQYGDVARNILAEGVDVLAAQAGDFHALVANVWPDGPNVRRHTDLCDELMAREGDDAAIGFEIDDLLGALMTELQGRAYALGVAVGYLLAEDRKGGAR